MKSRFFIFVFCFFCSFYSFAENAKTENKTNSSTPNTGLNAVLQQLQKNKLLRSEFKQARHLKILSRPLLSEGRLSYFSGKGIIWEIQKPVKSKIIISQNKITEINPGNAPVSRPNIGGIYTVLDALLNGNEIFINKNFAIDYSGSTEDWRIELTPKFAPLNKAFETIEMHGDHQIQRITLIDYNQDSTVITLNTIQTEPQSISSIEEAYFAN